MIIESLSSHIGDYRVFMKFQNINVDFFYAEHTLYRIKIYMFQKLKKNIEKGKFFLNVAIIIK